MKYAIVMSNGNQFRVEEGMTVEVDRITEPIGAVVNLPVMLLADGGAVRVGTPLVDGLEIRATVVEHILLSKIRIFKYKAKTRYRRRRGHRQPATRLTIEKIGKSSPSGQPVSILEIGTRAERALANAGISTIDDLREAVQAGGYGALLDVPGFGQKSLSDLKSGLDALGIEITTDR